MPASDADASAGGAPVDRSSSTESDSFCPPSPPRLAGGGDDPASALTAAALPEAAEAGAGAQDTAVTAEQVAYLRAHAKGAEAVDDATLRRFVRATGGNLPLVRTGGRLYVTIPVNGRVPAALHTHNGANM